jgi:methyl-accepting chemotaxis protein
MPRIVDASTAGPRPGGRVALLAVIALTAAALVFALVDAFGADWAAPAAALVVAIAAGLAGLVASQPVATALIAGRRGGKEEGAPWPPPSAFPRPDSAADATATPAAAQTAPAAAGDAAGRLIAQVAAFGALIREHALSVIDGTERAAVDFVGQLNAIDRAVKALTSFIIDAQASFRAIDDSSTDTTRRNAELLAELEATLAETRASLAIIVEERQALAEVVHTARTLAEKSAMIAGIARTTKMLSINANIEASRAGGEGSGFGVIAKEIRELSMHTDKTTREMAALIARSLDGLDQFFANSTRLENELAKVVAVVDKMTGHLRSVADGYGLMQTYVGDVTGRVDVHGQEIEQALLTTFAKVQFQDIVRQQLEGIIDGLDQLAEIARDDPGPGAGDCQGSRCRVDAMGQLLEQLSEGYVMQQQVDAHARATGRIAAAGGGGPAIELF